MRPTLYVQTLKVSMMQSLATVCLPKLILVGPMAQQQSYLLPVAIPCSIQQWNEESTINRLSVGIHGLDDPLGGIVLLLLTKNLGIEFRFSATPDI